MSNPTCPHCNTMVEHSEIMDNPGSIDWDDGGITEWDCSNCGESFHFKAVHQVDFETCDEEGDELYV